MSIARLVAEARESRGRKEKLAVASEWKKLADPRFVLQTQERAKCPLCKDFIGGNFNSSCSNCKTTYHNDCLLELTSSRCSTVGCNRFVQTVGEAKAEV